MLLVAEGKKYTIYQHNILKNRPDPNLRNTAEYSLHARGNIQIALLSSSKLTVVAHPPRVQLSWGTK
jgi:hypothetical protein